MKKTVTVGIPVYNEENNIAQLIKSVIQQKAVLYELERIIVLSDNSTDKTNELVHNLENKYSKVSLVAYSDRKGKCHRLNQLFQMNESEVLIAFDGDIALARPDVIEQIALCFDDNDVVLVGVNDIPVESNGFQHKIINAWYAVWNYVRINYRNGQNIYNIHGNALVLRKSFAKTITYPENHTADQEYLYLAAKQQNKKFVFAKKAIIYFHSPDTIKDFYFQTTRFLTEKEALLGIFGHKIKEEYYIPFAHKAKSIVMTLLKNPIFTAFAIIMYLYLGIFMRHPDPLQKKGMWQQVRSTKRKIQI